MAQGYSKLNNGYGEEPGVNWGKMAAYGAGGAAAYGLIRAGAIKGKKMAAPAFRSGKAIGGGILGMQMPNGWKGYQKLGNTVPKGIKKTDAMGRMINADTAAKKMRAAKMARRDATNLARGQYQSDLKAFRAHPSKDALMRDAHEQMWKHEHMEATMPRNQWGQTTPNHMAKVNEQGERFRTALEKAEAWRPMEQPSLNGVMNAKKGTGAADFDRIAALRPRTAARARPTPAALNSFESRMGGAKAFFGAMDYAKAGGMKQFGVGAARVGLAAGAIGLGMKALSALNPFSD